MSTKEKKKTAAELAAEAERREATRIWKAQVKAYHAEQKRALHIATDGIIRRDGRIVSGSTQKRGKRIVQDWRGYRSITLDSGKVIFRRKHLPPADYKP